MPEASASARAESARTWALVSVAALIANAGFALALEATDGASLALLGALLLVPLLAPLRGLWRRERRVYAWATLCLTPHFVYALTEIVANPGLRPLAALMLVLALAVLIALVAYLRLTRPQPP